VVGAEEVDKHQKIAKVRDSAVYPIVFGEDASGYPRDARRPELATPLCCSLTPYDGLYFLIRDA
jgi:hypothetical protein